mmetsp:Transcript_15188/g.34894  ORF Transcript_15188/g.34894 Transcript_15188/m.34894 type:complete len:80 (+) Transcript_15188:388-627(+)
MANLPFMAYLGEVRWSMSRCRRSTYFVTSRGASSCVITRCRALAFFESSCSVAFVDFVLHCASLRAIKICFSSCFVVLL